MYKVGDKVFHKGGIHKIEQLFNNGDCALYPKYNVFGTIEHTSELSPVFKQGDKVSLNGVLKESLLKQQFSKVDINNMEVLATCDGDVLIKGVGVYYPSSMFKYAPKPRHIIKYIVVDTLNADRPITVYDKEKDAIEKCETLNKVSINIGDIFKHSDGTAVEVVNSTLEETEVMLEIAGSVYYSKYNTQQFLKEFTK